MLSLRPGQASRHYARKNLPRRIAGLPRWRRCSPPQAAAQAAAIRSARVQLEEALGKLAELAVTDATQTGLAVPANLH
jgi:hypothetical protein